MRRWVQCHNFVSTGTWQLRSGDILGEEREVPVPEKLIELLKKFRPANASPDDPLFPSETGKPDGAMLEKLKAVALSSQ